MVSDEVEFRVLPGLPGYRVGADGSVWSCRVPGGKIDAVGPWVRLKRRDKRPQVATRLTPRGPVRFFALARLACEAWHGPPPRPPGRVAFADGDEANLSRANLSWAAAEPPAARVYHRASAEAAPTLADEHRRAAERMRADGASLAAIAAILGVHKAVVKASLPKR